MYYYTLFYHTIACDFPVPEAIEIEKPKHVDIRVEEGMVPQKVMDEVDAGYFDLIKTDTAWFYVKDLFVYYIEHGNHIIVHQVAEKTDELSKTTFLTGVAMAIALTQRGFIPMHGGALELKGSGFVVTGASGSGKSSTMTRLREMGAVFMADDISVIDTESLELLPGFPVQKLCGNMVEKLQLDKKVLTYIGEYRDKYAQHLEEKQYLYDKRPLKSVFEIVKGEVEEPQFAEITGNEKLKLIMRNIYCDFYVTKLPIEVQSMLKYIKIAQNIKTYRIIRPKDRDTLTELADWIFKKMLQNC